MKLDRSLLSRILIGLMLIQLIGGCGPSTRDKAMSTTLLAVNSARDGFIEWDRHHQNALADSATSIEDGMAKLEAYRAKREVVLSAFEVAYRALAVVAIHKKASVATVVDLAADLVKAIAELKSSVTSSP